MMETTGYFERGVALRLLAKELVLEFMATKSECAIGALGKTQASIFKECGLDWGEYPTATSSNQQYWCVALLRELEKEGKVVRNCKSKLWTLR